MLKLSKHIHKYGVGKSRIKIYFIDGFTTTKNNNIIRYIQCDQDFLKIIMKGRHRRGHTRSQNAYRFIYIERKENFE